MFLYFGPPLRTAGGTHLLSLLFEEKLTNTTKTKKENFHHNTKPENPSHLKTIYIFVIKILNFIQECIVILLYNLILGFHIFCRTFVLQFQRCLVRTAPTPLISQYKRNKIKEMCQWLICLQSKNTKIKKNIQMLLEKEIKDFEEFTTKTTRI